MPGIVFTTKNSGISEDVNGYIGKYLDPIKVQILAEGDICAKRDDIVKALYNVEKSTHYGEAFVTGNEFDIMAPVDEGGAAVQDTFKETASKLIKNIRFTKQLEVTEEMMADSSDIIMRQKAQEFSRAYYRTRNKLASALLHGATGGSAGSNTTITFGPAGHTKAFDITTSDGVPLFSAKHAEGTHNRFHQVLTGKLTSGSVAEYLSAAVSIIRNMKTERGDGILGYTADTIVIPSDDRELELAVKQALGSEFGNGAGGVLAGDINVHYGNWTLVVDPMWQRTVKTSHPIIVQSSTARLALSAANFLDRTDFMVHNFIDHDTLNLKFTGSARFGAGFVNHKYACLIDLCDKTTDTLLDGAKTGSTDESESLSA